MSNRMVLGQRGSASGIWISKPGHNVLTAGEDDMLLSTTLPSMQIVASGIISSPVAFTNYDRTIPNLGFAPIVLIGGSFEAGYTFPNATTLRIHVLSNAWGATTTPVTWAVTNQRILH